MLGKLSEWAFFFPEKESGRKWKPFHGDFCLEEKVEMPSPIGIPL